MARRVGCGAQSPARIDDNHLYLRHLLATTHLLFLLVKFSHRFEELRLLIVFVLMALRLSAEVERLGGAASPIALA
jgi:hypothetical protein